MARRSEKLKQLVLQTLSKATIGLSTVEISSKLDECPHCVLGVLCDLREAGHARWEIGEPDSCAGNKRRTFYFITDVGRALLVGERGK